MSIDYIGQDEGHINSGVDLALTVPSAVQAGDLLVIVGGQAIAAGSYSAPIDDPTNQARTVTLVDSVTEANVFSKVWRKTATSTTAGSTVTISCATNSGKGSAHLLAYRGVDTDNPIQAHATFVETTAGTSHATPGLTATGPGLLVATMSVNVTDLLSITPPSPWTQRGGTPVETGGGVTGVAVADLAVTGAGSVGGQMWTADKSTRHVVSTALILNPAAVVTPPPDPDPGLQPTPYRYRRDANGEWQPCPVLSVVDGGWR